MYRIAIVAMLILSVVAGGAVAPVAAEEDDDGIDEPPDPDPPWEDDDEEDDEDTVVFEFSDDARITDYEWEGQTIHVTLEADSRTTFTFTDSGVLVGASEGDSGEVPMQQFTLNSGEERTVEFHLTDERLVTVTADGTMWFSVEDGFGFFSGSASWSDVQAGVVAAAGVVGFITVSTAIIAYLAASRDYFRVV